MPAKCWEWMGMTGLNDSGDMFRAVAQVVARRRELAWAIRDCVDDSVWGRLGADDFRADGDVAPVLSFTARLVPMRADGSRGLQRRRVTVQVTYVEGLGVFDVFAFYYRAGRYRGHCSAVGVPEVSLGRFLGALDYSGSEVVNPLF